MQERDAARMVGSTMDKCSDKNENGVKDGRGISRINVQTRMRVIFKMKVVIKLRLARIRKWQGRER
jgi:hypothetical protein